MHDVPGTAGVQQPTANPAAVLIAPGHDDSRGLVEVLAGERSQRIKAEDDVVRLKEEMADCRVQNKAWREQWKQRATNFTLMMIRNEACG